MYDLYSSICWPHLVLARPFRGLDAFCFAHFWSTMHDQNLFFFHLTFCYVTSPNKRHICLKFLDFIYFAYKLPQAVINNLNNSQKCFLYDLYSCMWWPYIILAGPFRGLDALCFAHFWSTVNYQKFIFTSSYYFVTSHLIIWGTYVLHFLI